MSFEMPRCIVEEWSKSYPVRPRDHIKSHKYSKSKQFIPSYEYDPNPPQISMLLGWEYSRQCLKEREEFVKSRKQSEKKKLIKPMDTKKRGKQQKVKTSRFVMKRFQGIPSRVQHSWPPSGPPHAPPISSESPPSRPVPPRSKCKAPRPKSGAGVWPQVQTESTSSLSMQANMQPGPTTGASVQHTQFAYVPEQPGLSQQEQYGLPSAGCPEQMGAMPCVQMQSENVPYGAMQSGTIPCAPMQPGHVPCGPIQFEDVQNPQFSGTYSIPPPMTSQQVIVDTSGNCQSIQN